MPTYKYIAKDRNAQTITGMVEATNETEVVQLLHKKDLAVVSVESVKINQALNGVAAE